MFFKLALILIVISNSLSEGSPVTSDIGRSSSKSEPQEAIVINRYKKANESLTLCSTPACKEAANSVLKNMDPTINPCENFYLFACGKFLNSSEILDRSIGKNKSAMSPIEYDLHNKLNKSLSEAESENDIKPIKMIKQLYGLCMDEIRIEELGLDPMKKILERLGGWPVLEENWDERSFDWKQSAHKLRKEGFEENHILEFSIDTDCWNSTRRIMNIDSPNLYPIRQAIEIGEPMVEAYRRYMIDVAVAFGANRELATEDLRKSLEFETKLANISVSEEKYFFRAPISTVQRKFPDIPWLEYMNTILAPTNEVKIKHWLYISDTNYTERLGILLNSTSKRTQANYVMWKVVYCSIYLLNENMRKDQLNFENKLDNRTVKKPRWKECVEIVLEKFPIAVSAMYLKRFFDKDIKKNVSDMVEAILPEMHKILGSADWMDEGKRKDAMEKLKSISRHVAYPDELLDDKKIEEFYAKLRIPQNDYVGSILTVQKFRTERSISQLHKSINKTDWTSHIFPAVYLQGDYYSTARPQYLNYGAIGFTIGHEITHTFDTTGMFRDKNGVLDSRRDPVTEKLFLEKVQCLIEQYGNYTVEEVGMKLNGNLTRNENIADNGGVKLAYYAYKSWVQKNKPEPRLPGFQDYTPQQMFWLSAANSRCTKYTTEALKRDIEGVHSLAAFRVIGSFSNNKDFANDYQCPLGSKMNPEKKCEVW